MLYTFISLMFILSIIFLFLNHPLSMGMILFLQTILVCLISGKMSSSFWFSYILLLIYLGGMLILFMYITSIASNELFFYSNKIFLCLLPLPFCFFVLLNFNTHLPFNLPENLENFINSSSITNLQLLKLYNQPINIMTIMIASYLFLTLIVVVKIINIFKGPIRQFIYAKTFT